jgi:hypothetical protein
MPVQVIIHRQLIYKEVNRIFESNLPAELKGKLLPPNSKYAKLFMSIATSISLNKGDCLLKENTYCWTISMDDFNSILEDLEDGFGTKFTETSGQRVCNDMVFRDGDYIIFDNHDKFIFSGGYWLHEKDRG